MSNEELENGLKGEDALPAASVPTTGAPAALPVTLAPAPPHRRQPHTKRPRGKIGRLPLLIRNVVNQAIRDGLPYAEIGSLLAARGFPGCKPTHVSRWAKYGYKQWLAEQERFEQSRPRSDRAAALLGHLRDDGRCEIADLNECLLAVQQHDLLDSLDENQLRQMIADDPDAYFRLTRSVTSLALARAKRFENELKRLKYDLEIRKIEERERRRLKPQEITPEMRARIEAAAKLL